MTVTSTKTTKKKAAAPKKTRVRRSPEQIVAELQAKIDDVKARAAAREVKQSAEGKALLAALKAVEKASRVAQEAGDRAMLGALEAARAPLAEHLEEMGVSRPKARKPRRGRAQAEPEEVAAS